MNFSDSYVKNNNKLSTSDMSISVSAAFRSVIHYCIICHCHFLHLSFPAMHFPVLQIWSHSFQYCILSTLSLLRYSGGWTGGHTLSQYLRMPIDSDCCIYCWQKKQSTYIFPPQLIKCYGCHWLVTSGCLTLSMTPTC